jgi:hypothetical protein
MWYWCCAILLDALFQVMLALYYRVLDAPFQVLLALGYIIGCAISSVTGAWASLLDAPLHLLVI